MDAWKHPPLCMSPVTVWHQLPDSTAVPSAFRGLHHSAEFGLSLKPPGEANSWAGQSVIQHPPASDVSSKLPQASLFNQREQGNLSAGSTKKTSVKSCLGLGQPSISLLKGNSYTDSLTWSWKWILKIAYTAGFRPRSNNGGMCGSLTFNLVSTGIIYHLCIEKTKIFQITAPAELKGTSRNHLELFLPSKQGILFIPEGGLSDLTLKSFSNGKPTASLGNQI